LKIYINDGVYIKNDRGEFERFKASSVPELKELLDERNKDYRISNPDVYKISIENFNGTDAVLIWGTPGYIDGSYDMYVLMKNKDILQFAGEDDPYGRKVLSTFKFIPR